MLLSVPSLKRSSWAEAESPTLGMSDHVGARRSISEMPSVAMLPLTGPELAVAITGQREVDLSDVRVCSRHGRSGFGVLMFTSDVE